MSYRFLPPLFDFFFGRGTFDIDLILGFTATRISLLIGSLLHVHRVIMSFYGHHEPGRLRTQSSNVANDFFLVIWRVAFSWSSTLVGIPLQSQWTRWRLFFFGGGVMDLRFLPSPSLGGSSRLEASAAPPDSNSVSVDPNSTNEDKRVCDPV